MKIKGLLIIVICMIGLSGCTSKGFDIERVYQFVEIQSSNGKEIGTIVNSDDLEFFFEEMKFQEWKYIEEKEDFGKCIYKFIAYEFVKDDEEYCIREDPYELYKVDDNYYIIQDSDVISIPKRTGQFLNSIENKITITQPISEDILDNWENRIVNNTDSSYGTKKNTYNDETIVSNITKIVISDEDELDIKIDNKEEITAFIEGLDTDSWSSIDDIPNDAILRRNISAYSFRRRTKEKVLTTMYTIMLYEASNNEYFISETIPDNGTQDRDYIEYYTIPKSVADFIINHKVIFDYLFKSSYMPV